MNPKFKGARKHLASKSNSLYVVWRLKPHNQMLVFKYFRTQISHPCMHTRVRAHTRTHTHSHTHTHTHSQKLSLAFVCFLIHLIQNQATIQSLNMTKTVLCVLALKKKSTLCPCAVVMLSPATVNVLYVLWQTFNMKYKTPIG